METIDISDATKQAHYGAIVRQLIEHDARTARPSHGDIEVLVLVDEHLGSYMLVSGTTRSGSSTTAQPKDVPHA